MVLEGRGWESVEVGGGGGGSDSQAEAVAVMVKGGTYEPHSAVVLTLTMTSVGSWTVVVVPTTVFVSAAHARLV